MTFETREESAQDGAPVELYTFTVYGVLYHFTSAGTAQQSDVFTYEPQVMQRSEIEESGQIARNDLTLTTAETFPMTRFFDPWPPSEVMQLTIYRLHRGETDPVAWWSGRVLNCDWRDGNAVFHCENIFTSLRRTGLRRLYSRNCPHVLYGAACRADKAVFKQSTTVTGIDGRSVELAAVTGGDGRFVGGYLEWEFGINVFERRGVKGHAGTVLELTHPIGALEVGSAVDIYPGCAHDVDDCNSFFNNIVNYGGWPFFQQKNPMGGNSVF